MNVSIIYYITSLGEESNPQQSYYKYDVLPLNYLGKDSPVEIRTPTKGTKNLCATVTPPENIKLIIPQIACRGIEPLVSSVKGTHLNHSTNRP